MDTLGFIFPRHVSSEKTNLYWQYSYDQIRRYYPDNPIVIIDDSSRGRPDLITEKEMTNTIIIDSEYPGRGELLPYIYYLKYKWFPRAMIMNDSVFINSQLDLTFDKYKMLWCFENPHENVAGETFMLSQLSNSEKLLELYHDPSKWYGCFATMSLISLEFLIEIDAVHDIKRLLDLVTTRANRCALERVMGCMLQANYPLTVLLGSIHSYCQWGFSWDQKEYFNHLPLIKVWTGR